MSDLRKDRWAVNAWMTLPLSDREQYVPERLRLVEQLREEGWTPVAANAAAGFEIKNGVRTEMSGRYPHGTWYAQKREPEYEMGEDE